MASTCSLEGTYDLSFPLGLCSGRTASLGVGEDRRQAREIYNIPRMWRWVSTHLHLRTACLDVFVSIWICLVLAVSHDLSIVSSSAVGSLNILHQPESCGLSRGTEED